MDIDFFPHFSVFYECVPPLLTFPGLLFTRQVLVSLHKSNEELLKCTTGTDPCKDHQQPSLVPSLPLEERVWEEDIGMPKKRW